MLLVALLIIVLLPHVTAHAVLRVPTPRRGMDTRPGLKLSGVLEYLDTCGGSAAGDPGPQPATQTFRAGSTVAFSWLTTITHPSNPGVRFAISYGNNGAFGDNVLVSGLNAGANGVHTVDVTLPSRAGPAVIQWSWVSLADGGSYVACADVVLVSSTDGDDDDGAGDTGGAGGAFPGTFGGIRWQGGFESGTTSEYSEILPGSATRVSVVPKAEELSPRCGERFLRVMINGDDTAYGHNRVEIGFHPAKDVPEAMVGTTRYYGWSMAHSKNEPLSPDSTYELAYWESENGFKQTIGFYISDGKTLKLRTRGNRDTEIGSVEFLPGTWHDFVLGVKWSAVATEGWVELYHGGELAIPRTQHSTLLGNSPTFSHFGIFRIPRVNTEVTMYYDCAVYAESYQVTGCYDDSAKQTACMGASDEDEEEMPPMPDETPQPMPGDENGSGEAEQNPSQDEDEMPQPMPGDENGSGEAEQNPSQDQDPNQNQDPNQDKKKNRDPKGGVDGGLLAAVLFGLALPCACITGVVLRFGRGTS